MKYIAVLLLVLMLAGCDSMPKLDTSSSKRFEMVYIINSLGADGIVTDNDTGCKYIYFRQALTPLYKNSKEVDCDKE